MYKNKRVLITGGMGFIGSNLAIKLIEMGAQVTVVDSLFDLYGGNEFNLENVRNQIEFKLLDIRDIEGITDLVKEKDFLFNLAGQTSHLDSMVNPENDLEINAKAQLTILEAVRKYNPTVRIIYAGTRQVYGEPRYFPVDEAHPLQPVDVNGINKLAGEQYHILYCKVYGVRATVLRLTNTYGPRMRVKDSRQTFLGIWIKSVIDGVPFKVFGDGSQLRDFTYIDDCVDAFLRIGLCQASIGRIYNLGGCEIISLRDVADKIIQFNAESSYQLIEFPGDRKKIDIGDYYANYSLVQEVCGWQPRVNLTQGLIATIDYFKKFKKHYW